VTPTPDSTTARDALARLARIEAAARAWHEAHDAARAGGNWRPGAPSRRYDDACTVLAAVLAATPAAPDEGPGEPSTYYTPDRVLAVIEPQAGSGVWLEEAAEEQATAATQREIMFARAIVGREWRPDHACGECVPGGEIVRDGFRCAYHEALALLGQIGIAAVTEEHAS